MKQYFSNYQFNNAHICTNDGKITVGEVYQYKEALLIRDVKLEELYRLDQIWCFKLLRLESVKSDDTYTVSFNADHQNYAYSGMWRLWGKDTFDIEKARQIRQRLLDQRDYQIPTIDFGEIENEK